MSAYIGRTPLDTCCIWRRILRFSVRRQGTKNVSATTLESSQASYNSLVKVKPFHMIFHLVSLLRVASLAPRGN